MYLEISFQHKMPNTAYGSSKNFFIYNFFLLKVLQK